MTITLKDLGGTTRLTLTPAGFPEGEVVQLASAGWNESCDKLAESLR